MSRDFDPYQSPQSQPIPPDGYPPPGAKKSSAVLAAAIINWVWGGLKFLSGCCVSIFVGLFIANTAAYDELMRKINDDPTFQQSPELKELIEFIREHVALVMALYILALVIGILALIAGFGVYKRKPWGRMLSFLAAGLEAVAVVINVWMSIKMKNAAGFIDILFPVGYVLTIFILLNRPDAKAEFESAARAGSPYGNYGAPPSGTA